VAKLQKTQEPIPFSAHKLVSCFHACGVRYSKAPCALAIRFYRRCFVASSAYHYRESLVGVALPTLWGAVLHYLVRFQRPVRSTLFPLWIAEVFERPEFRRCTMNCWTFNRQLLVNTLSAEFEIPPRIASAIVRQPGVSCRCWGRLLVRTQFIVVILRQSRHSAPADDAWPEPLERSV
jgi:hypothetical protein